LGGGSTLSLQIPAEAFANSIHQPFGCANCHSDVNIAKHPGNGKKIKSAREFSIAMVAVCRGCHDEVAKQYDQSVHAARLKAGNQSAPVCTDCHSSHAIRPKTAYDNCVKCHETAIGAHQKWQPNARLHLEVVSCAACHAPLARQILDLRLYDGAARKWAAEPEGNPQFEKMARATDTNGNGLDATELQNLMKKINGDPALPTLTLRGRIELRTGVEVHRIADKTKAVRECTSCHKEGAEPFQTVTVSIATPAGRPLRYEAHPNVLTSVLSRDTLREFYAIGGSRSVLLDILFVLAVLGGLAIPTMHPIMKRIVRRLEAKKAAAASANPQNGAHGATGSDRDPPRRK